MQEKVIIGVADVIESRDDSTGTHIKNTADYVERLSKKALERGIYPDIIDKHFVEMVIRAAPMHDLGKIAIPDAILKKPGPLTREEFEIMKTHAPKGGQMVAQILEGVTDEDYTRIAFEVANYHHEKWDGTGYPDRLAGDAIPLSARIMALDDVYDALTMERVYKKAFPKDVALSIIKAGIGTQFDPLLGPIFVELMEGKDAEGDEASSASDRADRYQGKNRRWRRWSLKRIALTGLLSGTLLILMLCLILGVPVWESSGELAPGEASQWMAPLSDDLSLSQIHIPGTHDSASYYVRLPYFLRCQNTEIADQLLAGFRYLDLRLRSEKGRIILCHGFGTCRKEKNPFSQELTLEDVLEQVYDFLEDNPTETVVIAAKAERDEAEAIDIEDAFQRQIKEHPQRWLITQTLPTLGEARGRVVLLRRYEDVLNLGEESGIYAKWEQQTSEVPLEEAMTEYDCAGLHLFVQDRFCYNVEGKLSLIAAGLKQASEIDPKDSLRIHFCNTTGIRRISHPKTVSATINEQVKGMEFLGDFGWVIFDYGTPKLAKWIYSTNQVS